MFMSIIGKFKQGLSRSKIGFIGRLDGLFGVGDIDDSFFDELEEILVSGDVGVKTSIKLVEQLKEEIKVRNLKDKSEARKLLYDLIMAIMKRAEDESELKLEDALPGDSPAPRVILLVGVNGSGKTTSAAKLAHMHARKGKKVLLVAGDTYRAAAIEQLQIWAERAGVEMIRQQQGSDPSALFYDAINAARARSVDLVIGDTAGRLHSKFNLMEELSKIYRVVDRNLQGESPRVLLVIDATTGQNALAQARKFNQSLPLDGLVLTKLDGTARGGIVLNIGDELDIPVLYVGTGEQMDDLTPFDPEAFTAALLEV